MKLKWASIRNFKGIAGPLEIDFQAGRGTRPLTCLVGDNGSGKTTVLQAIALVLSLATRRTRSPTEFNWHGFLPERVGSLGPTRVELIVALDQDEIALTRKLFERWRDSRAAERIQAEFVEPPSELGEVTLVYEKGRCVSPEGAAAKYQFLGRYYARQLVRTSPDLRKEFARLGDVFWFDQMRNLGSAGVERDDQENGAVAKESWQAGVEQLREFLVGMWGYHTSTNKSYGTDYIGPLERGISNIFPGTVFRGIAPREGTATPGARDFYFLLERDRRVYDLAEMSSGEQAVFPLLYEFVRLDIARSVVLIDELELHLHPPQQQALLSSLRKLGPDCQFIITTHSQHLTEAIPNEHEIRLEGGRRCL
jgi:energy-coupling factor transporter ATP-binding protein EcfA2